HAFSVFGGQRVISQSKQFRGASLTAFFGGVTLDLRQAKPAPDGADVDVMTAFGGAQVLVPAGWLVLFSGIPTFGCCEDRTSHRGDEAGPQLRIRGTAVFGGAWKPRTVPDAERQVGGASPGRSDPTVVPVMSSARPSGSHPDGANARSSPRASP